MISSVTVYFNTGFNGIDIPASPSVLATARSKTYPEAIFIREDIDKPTIKLKDSYENLRNVDYCTINTSIGTSYFFASPASLAKGVTLLSLELDALLTMGGAPNLTYLSGWQERGHIAKVDDELFANIAAEEWTPSQPLEAHGITTIKGQGSFVNDDLDIVISNIDLSHLGTGTLTQDVIAGIVSGTTTSVMYFPSIKSPISRSVFVIWDFSENQAHRFAIPNTCAYDASNNMVKDGLDKLYSCGQLQLQGSYQIPKEYLGNDPTSGAVNGFLQNLVGYYGTQSLSAIPYEYTIPNYTIKNKKCFTTFRNMHLVAIASGDENIRPIYELYKSGDTNPTIRLWADPSSTGKPYARFDYITDSNLQYSDCVRGLQWANSQLVMEGASGSLWNSINNAFSNQQIQQQMAFNGFQSAIASGQNEISKQNIINQFGTGQIQNTLAGIMGIAKGNPTGALAGYLGTELSKANALNSLENIRLSEQLQKNQSDFANTQLQNQINQNAIGLIKSNSIVAPTVSFTPEQNLGLYGYNYFASYEVRKSDKDLISEDMYYQRYGYNGLHRPLTGQCFNERQYYCFVQAFDVNLKNSNTEYGLRIRQKAISQLNQGVRVWKVLPDAQYYETN